MSGTVVTDSGVDWQEHLENIADEMTDVESLESNEVTGGDNTSEGGIALRKRRSLVPTERTKENEAGESKILYSNPLFLSFIFVGGVLLMLVLVCLGLAASTSTHSTITHDLSSSRTCLALGTLSNHIAAEAHHASLSLRTPLPPPSPSPTTDALLASLLSAPGYGPGLATLPTQLAAIVTPTYLSTLRNNFTLETEPELLTETGVVLHQLLLLTLRTQRVATGGHEADMGHHLLGKIQTETDLQVIVGHFMASGSVTDAEMSYLFSVYKESCHLSSQAGAFLMSLWPTDGVTPCLDWETVYRGEAVEDTLYWGGELMAELGALRVTLQGVAASVLLDEEVKTEHQVSMWIALGCSLLVFGFLQSFVVREHQRTARYEQRLRDEFVNGVGVTEIIRSYCENIARWDFNQPTSGDLRIEGHLRNAIRCLVYLRPFVPAWVFAWTIETAMDMSLKEREEETPRQGINFTAEGDDDSRKESVFSSTDTDESEDNNDKPDPREVHVRGSRYVNLCVGLQSVTKTLGVVSLGNLNQSWHCHAPPHRDVAAKTVDTVVTASYALLHQVCACVGATLVDLNPLYATIDFQWCGKPHQQHVKACMFALQVGAARSEVVVQRAQEKVGGSPFEDLFPNFRVAVVHGEFRVGILSTGTFKTHYVANKKFKMLLKMCRLADYTGVNILVDAAVRKHATKKVPGVFGMWGVVHGIAVHRLMNEAEMAAKVVLKMEKSMNKKRKDKSTASSDVGKEVDETVKLFFTEFRAKRYISAAKKLKSYVSKHESGGKTGGTVPTTPILRHLHNIVMEILGPNKEHHHDDEMSLGSSDS